jgi:putative membrane protein
MSDQHNSNASDGTLRPQVFMRDSESVTNLAEQLAPRVVPMAETGRIIPPPPAEVQPTVAGVGRRRRYSLMMRLGLTGLIAAFWVWLGIDLYLWIAAAFDKSTALGWAGAAAIAAGLAAAAAIIGHEATSYLALKTVEATQQRLAAPWATIRLSDAQKAIQAAIADIPKDRESCAAVESFQQKVKRHHTPGQQLELFSQTVMKPLDQRAEAIVRRAGARAFGITAISPSAITDAIFFIACSVRMVREIASCYGHRPSAFATAHLLRRLVVEAGKLGVVDLAGATLSQHIGGAIAERVATSAAESLYAAQRMARLGLMTMGLCRPIPFRPNELPAIFSSLIGNLFAHARNVPR